MKSKTSMMLTEDSSTATTELRMQKLTSSLDLQTLQILGEVTRNQVVVDAIAVLSGLL